VLDTRYKITLKTHHGCIEERPYWDICADGDAFSGLGVAATVAPHA